MLARPEVRAPLAGHDIGALFRVLREHGWTQREIARATGMPQSSVSEIVKGRRVIGYRLLVRIADGLVIPRELMGLGADEGSAYAGGVTVTELGEEMRRRALLAAAAGIAIAGRPLQNLGELVPLPGPVPPPSQILPVHVAKMRDLTQQLRRAGRAYGSDPGVSSAAAEWASRLLSVPGAEPTTRALRTAVAELHIHAGWAAFDAGLYDRTMHHYHRGLELATELNDAYLQAIALSYAGLATEEHGHPNDGLKVLQIRPSQSVGHPHWRPARERYRGERPGCCGGLRAGGFRDRLRSPWTPTRRRRPVGRGAGAVAAGPHRSEWRPRPGSCPVTACTWAIRRGGTVRRGVPATLGGRHQPARTCPIGHPPRHHPDLNRPKYIITPTAGSVVSASGWGCE